MDRSHLKWLQGMLFVLGVAIFWIVASYMVQSIEESGLAPFLLTYICNSLFIIYIPIVEASRFFRRCAQRPNAKWQLHKEINFTTDQNRVEIQRPIQKPGSLVDSLRELAARSSSLSQWLAPSSSRAAEDLSLLSDTAKPSGSTSGAGTWTGGRWTRVRTAAVSLLICPFWFFAQFTFNVSLHYTSVSSNTILSSSSTLFTFLFSMYFLGERFTLVKLLSVVLCLVGTALVSLADTWRHPGEQEGHSTLLGDLLCLLSSCLYAAYTSLIRGLTPAEGGQEEMGGSTAEIELPAGVMGSREDSLAEDGGESRGRQAQLGKAALANGTIGDDVEAEQFSTALLFGYIGLWNLLLLMPVGLLLHLAEVEAFHWPAARQWELVLGKGFMDNVLSDYLWARAVLLTTPTAATAGLQIQIPIALTVDSIVGHEWPDALHLVGALLVLLGFLGINSTITFGAWEGASTRLKETKRGHERVPSLEPVHEGVTGGSATEDGAMVQGGGS